MNSVPTLCFFQNGVISYELEKMQTAKMMLKDLEQRCTANANSGWLTSLRTMVFGGGQSTPSTSLVQRLEEQIILADTQLCSAILTFLTQDISGMMRGSWLLKRAWKIYQNVYQQIYALYRDSVGEEDVEALNILPQLNPKLLLRHSSSNTTVSSSGACSDWSITSNDSTATNAETSARGKGIVQSVSDYFLSSSSTSTANPEGERKKKWSRNKSKKNKIPRSKSNPSSQKQTPSSNHDDPPIESSVLHRLMGAVSFGYGVFQLSVSLLPPSMLKLVSFFGFEGDRDMALSCLKFSRTTSDMRAPLATIALLWYWTVGHQIFAAENQNLDAEIGEVTAILAECEKEFSNSALFLFFKGRLQRMHKDMPNAIQLFERAYYTSCLPELRLLCLHEIGWCRLLQLDCLNAIDEFHALRVNSDYSKSFFIYLTALCHGVAEKRDDLMMLRRECIESVVTSPQKDSQIDQFIRQRVDLLPDTEEGMQRLDGIFFRFLVYELLFLWNTLDQCSAETLDRMISDCKLVQAKRPQEQKFLEPIPGVSQLILASCQALQGQKEVALNAYRDCLKHRQSLDEETNAKFTHISAFATYKLAILLLSLSPSTCTNAERTEAHQLLQTAQHKYKNYDFESRLSLRIHTALKDLTL